MIEVKNLEANKKHIHTHKSGQKGNRNNETTKKNEKQNGEKYCCHD